MVTFSEVPPAIRVPGVFIEVGANAANAQGAGQPYRLALIGQMLAAGTADPNTPTPITRAEDALVLFGSGSMLGQMAAAALANGRFVDITAIGIEDDGDGAKAAGSFDVATTTVRAGDLPLYVGGTRVVVPLTAGMTAAQVATAIAARITAIADLPVTAAANAASCVVTAKHFGAIGNEIDLRVAALEGDRVPTGVTVTTGAMAGGSGAIDLAAALAALGDTQYQVVACPYNASADLDATVAAMEDRATATRQLGGVAVTAATGTQAQLTTLGGGQNSERLIVIGAAESPSSPWQWAAAVGALIARDAQGDPARPFTTAQVAGVMPAASADRPNDLERDTFLRNGVATVVVNPGGQVAVERLITTYRLNDLGAPDPTFLDANSVLTLELIRFEMRQLGSKFARFKVADDGQVFAPGQEVLTPNGLKGEILALYSSWVERGLCENASDFAEALIVERNATDRSRLDVQMAPDVVNGLRVLGTRVILTL